MAQHQQEAVKRMQSQQDAEAAAGTAAEVVPNSSNAVTVVKPMIDLGTMQDDGLISAQDAQQYLAYRQIVEHAHKYGIFNSNSSSLSSGDKGVHRGIQHISRNRPIIIGPLFNMNL